LVREENYDFNQVIINAVWNKTVNDYSEVDYYHPEGGMKRLAATTSYLLESNQEETRFIGFVAIFKDITEVHTLRQKEKKLLEDRDRISRDKMRSLNRLAMGVAHEIRNPVVIIGGFASRIMKGPHVDAETRSYAQNILGGAKRLESLVEEVQSCVNMPDIQLITGSMKSVFREIVKEMEPGAARKGIRIVFHNLQSQSKKSRFDPDLIKIALTNLLNNAIDFSHDGSLVDVFLYEGEHETILGVKDYGIGISEADSEFLFDPFFSTKPQGTGMGLMITERVVHEHGGKIQFDSVPGKGALFRITIPNDTM
jgi:signal transduction histidine kinase